MRKQQLTYPLIGLMLMLLLGSCINLRYTDYGKPFDFLKAKNQYVKTKKQSQDTAAVFREELAQETVPISPLESKPKTIKTITIAVENPEAFPLQEEELDAEKTITQKTPVEKPHQQQTALELNASSNVVVSREQRPPGWWQDMWRSIWKFFLKWFLIILAALIVLALILWGIYALIAVLANPTVAGIVVACIVMIIWFFIEYS
jgi:hypothetical protein